MQANRQSLRQQRRAITASERVQSARQILHQIQKISNTQDGQKIALYLENDGEISPKHIHNFLEKQGIGIYLPILVGKSLKFAKIGNEFKKNKFGIDEPVATEILNAEQLDVIFIPLVGFDKHKNRIGMGGGFYDRTLSFKKNQTNHSNPKLYGLAFDCQQVTKIESQSWDVALDAIITPTKIY
ncbi:5-formyltetrahydrofolate cyclo-ligase (EC [uncultured Gammaproteobacteria bacterium]|jgi:5-formyltetrahydrofolate cyclo-ligase|nr:5-formyltetrahydrofolate cyclo-ligase (EC 6.3.3.2) [uncultured Gammaproteobacteria bacterium]VVH65938.1 5-formyltetrahydrofolate cyclo-ligase (EC [uncultured Gammaproteobacteria bacterium]